MKKKIIISIIIYGVTLILLMPVILMIGKFVIEHIIGFISLIAFIAWSVLGRHSSSGNITVEREKNDTEDFGWNYPERVDKYEEMIHFSNTDYAISYGGHEYFGCIDGEDHSFYMYEPEDNVVVDRDTGERYFRYSKNGFFTK